MKRGELYHAVLAIFGIALLVGIWVGSAEGLAGGIVAYLVAAIAMLVVLGGIDTLTRAIRHERAQDKENAERATNLQPLFERLTLDDLMAESAAGWTNLARPCPFCEVWPRPHAGGGERYFDPEREMHEGDTSLDYRCRNGHTFTAHTIVTGERNTEASSAA